MQGWSCLLYLMYIGVRVDPVNRRVSAGGVGGDASAARLRDPSDSHQPQAAAGCLFRPERGAPGSAAKRPGPAVYCFWSLPPAPCCTPQAVAIHQVRSTTPALIAIEQENAWPLQGSKGFEGSVNALCCPRTQNLCRPGLHAAAT